MVLLICKYRAASEVFSQGMHHRNFLNIEEDNDDDDDYADYVFDESIPVPSTRTNNFNNNGDLNILAASNDSRTITEFLQKNTKWRSTNHQISGSEQISPMHSSNTEPAVYIPTPDKNGNFIN